MKTRAVALALLMTFAASGQRPQPSRPVEPSDPADIQRLSRTVQGLRRTAQLNSDAGAQVDKLLQESASLLSIEQTGEARRRLANAQSLITGKQWTPKEEFVWSLILRPRPIVFEPSRPYIAELSQLYSAAYKSPRPLQMRMILTTIGGEPKPIRELTTIGVPSRDLISEPLPVLLDFSGTAGGSYRLVAELSEDGAPVVTLQQTIAIAEGIESRAADVERRLSRIQGHDSAKASVRWPFDMARVVNLGIRKLESGDFGLPESGAQVFDFEKELRDSEEILKALESGKDPLFRAKGGHERHYWFEEARQIMPYRVYVPTTWDGKQRLPMIFVLHGNTRDHNFYFDRDGGLLAKLAEKHGYIVATTMGYRPSAGYNASAINSLLPAPPTSPPGTGGFVRTAAMQRETELSEQDAIASFDRIVKEFNPDPSRIYLFGHSAGGTGGWYLGSKYAERFAGLALSAFNTQPANVPFDKLKGMPLLVIVGSKDTPRTVETARAMAKAVAEKGFENQFLEIPEATHDTIVGLALPTVFQFFTAKGKK